MTAGQESLKLGIVKLCLCGAHTPSARSSTRRSHMDLIAEWFRRLAYLFKRSRHDAALRAEMESHRALMADPKRFGNALAIREDARDVLGMALAGRRRARRAICGADARPRAGVHDRHRQLARARDRRDDGNLQHRQRRAAAGRCPSPSRNVSFKSGSSRWSEGRGRSRSPICRSSARRAAHSSVSPATVPPPVSWRRGPGSERVTGVVADREFFAVLGVQPIAGRTFDAGDPPTVAVLSEALWTRQFDRDPGIVGRTVALTGNRWDAAERRSVIDRQEITVIGVMPERFQFPYSASAGFPGALPESRTDLWIPEQPSRPRARDRAPEARRKRRVGRTGARAARETSRRHGARPVQGHRRAAHAPRRRGPRGRAPVVVAAVRCGRSGPRGGVRERRQPAAGPDNGAYLMKS